MRKKTSNIYALLGTASVMGLHMVSGPIVGAGLGWLIDKYLHTSPYGIIIGIILGVLAGYLNVIKDSKNLEKERERSQVEAFEDVEEEKIKEHHEYGLFGDSKKITLSEEEKKRYE